MIAAVKTWAALAGVVVVLLAGSNAWTYLRADATGYARGVRDQKILAIAATEMLNARLRAAEDEARAAAIRAGDAARELMTLQTENARERARDPDSAGAGLPLGELRRVFRVPGR